MARYRLAFRITLKDTTVISVAQRVFRASITISSELEKDPDLICSDILGFIDGCLL